MALTRVWVFPMLSVGCTLLAILGSFAIGVSLNHFPLLLPFISEGGALPPESCVFAHFLNSSAFFLVLTAYLRHRQIVEYYGHRLHQTGMWRCFSQFLLFVGIVSAIGITVVANFPEADVPLVHQIGAIVTFLCSVLYAWGQVIFGYIMTPHMTSPCVSHLRTILVFLATAALVLHELCLHKRIFVPAGYKDEPLNSHQYSISPDSPLFLNHIISTAAEWSMVLLLQGFILSFALELQYAYVHAPKVEFTPCLPEDDQRLLIEDVDDDPVPSTSTQTQDFFC